MTLNLMIRSRRVSQGNLVPSLTHRICSVLIAGIFLLATGSVHAQRTVNFPPAEAPPPPPAKAPPRTQAGGEETDITIDPGPSMRKTQHRTPPPPTNESSHAFHAKTILDLV